MNNFEEWARYELRMTTGEMYKAHAIREKVIQEAIVMMDEIKKTCDDSWDYWEWCDEIKQSLLNLLTKE